MDQISPPMRIALLVAVVFAAAWMLVLKPKDEAVAPAPTPVTAVPATEAGGEEATTSLGQAVEGAREAAGSAEESARARAGETETAAPGTTNASPADPAAEPATEPGAKPVDAALADLPKWLGESMDRKVVALLFTNRDSADDLRTEKALKKAYDGNGAVVTRSVPIARIADYQGVAEGLDVSQSPTLMIIARDRTAQAISGYASINTINQAIIDGLLATENPVKNVDFLKLAQAEGREVMNKAIIGVTPGTTPAAAEKNINATLDEMNESLGVLRNAPVPKAHADVKRLLIDYIESEVALGRQILGLIGPKGVDVIAARKAERGNDQLMRRALLELNAVGVSTWN